MGQTAQCCDRRDKEEDGVVPLNREGYGGYGRQASKLEGGDVVLVLPPLSTRFFEWPAPASEPPSPPPVWAPPGAVDAEVI
mmetsp:Transcript_109996/g.355156  ORF Transcript_109996/g.355156 Transcript_109996/m.355156 type:complete len:81 (+) Transcript_109996:2-244(+)